VCDHVRTYPYIDQIFGLDAIASENEFFGDLRGYRCGFYPPDMQSFQGFARAREKYNPV
jgi:hypothetical protein